MRYVGTVEELMRPGRLSTSGFLGPNERLEQVLTEDDRLVKTVLGTTHEVIADRIEYFVREGANATPFSIDGIHFDGTHVDEIYFVRCEEWMGGQECPYGDVKTFMPYSSMDFQVTNKRLGEKLFFPGGIVHLIRNHHFYEGRESPYRVDPRRACRVLDINTIKA